MSNKKKKLSWKQAFNNTPAPDNYFDALTLFIKGICMGAADIIPGVSGGTIAFITGIYQSLINAIASFDLYALKKTLKLNFREALAHVHLKFIILLFSGVSLAIMSTASLMHSLLEHYPILTWSAFFGLILGSIYIIFNEIEHWNINRFIMVALGTAAAWKICGLIPVSTPETYWFLFICGIIGICAMILPGLSGSFLLLVLGKYYYITGAIKTLVSAIKLATSFKFAQSYELLASTGAFWALCVFQCGQITGIIGFSRFLKWVLARWHQGTMCALVGIMIGAMRKIWPWKHQLVKHIIDNKKEKVIEEVLVLPWNFSKEFSCKIYEYSSNKLSSIKDITIEGSDPQTIQAISFIVAGVITVLALEKIAKIQEERSRRKKI